MISGKKIVITGANSGIGLEVLKLLAQGNNRILAVDLHTDMLMTLDQSKVFPFKCDVGNAEGVDRIFEAAREKLGTIDIFYANAGFPYYERMNYCDWERIQALLNVNTVSPIYAFQKYQQFLKGRDGHFALTISAMGKMALPGYSIYAASKFAMQGFQEAIRLELPKSISLTCLYPVATDTGFFAAAADREFKKPFPVQKPEHVAKAMVKGLEHKKKYVNPCKAFSFARVMFAILPFTKKMYWNMELKKFKNFVESGK